MATFGTSGSIPAPLTFVREDAPVTPCSLKAAEAQRGGLTTPRSHSKYSATKHLTRTPRQQDSGLRTPHRPALGVSRALVFASLNGILLTPELNKTPVHGLPGWLGGKESTCQCRRRSLTPGSGRCPGEGNGDPLQSSCLENRMVRGACRAAVYGVAKRRIQLSSEITT